MRPTNGAAGRDVDEAAVGCGPPRLDLAGGEGEGSAAEGEVVSARAEEAQNGGD